MAIQGVSFTGVDSVLMKRPKKPHKTNTPTVVTNPDTFELKEYSKQTFTDYLSSLKSNKGNFIYNKQNVMAIVNNVDKEPAKYNAVLEMALLPNMKGKDLERISSASADSLNIVNEISKKKNERGNYKYSSSHLANFAKMPTSELERIKPLTDTTLSGTEIYSLAKDDAKLDLGKLATNITQMEKSCGKLLDKISFKKDIYDPDNAYVLKASMISGNEKSVLLDKKMNRLAIDETENYTSAKGTEYMIVKTNDLRNNTVSKVRQYINDEGYPIVESQVRIIKDKKGNVQQTEYMTLSEVQGVYNVKNTYPNGKVEEVASGSIDKKTGIVSVKRDMKSLDGTRTQYLYENDPEGNRIIDYKITDKDGKVLMNLSQSLEIIDDKKFITSKNDKVYEVTVSDDEKTMTVKDRKTKEENSLDLGNMLRGDKKSMVNLLKKFPGEELMELKDTTHILKGMKKMDDCCFWPDKKEIDIVDDLYSVLHELGHAKDMKDEEDGITGRKDVQEVYDKEKEAFNKAFPNAQRDHINYFIDINEHYSGPRGGLEETVAEANALTNSYNGELDIAARAQYLQQYFPKTIAKLATILHK